MLLNIHTWDRLIVYAACMTICLPFIDFHSTNAAPIIESEPAATET
jgi:hypothetical protein